MENIVHKFSKIKFSSNSDICLGENRTSSNFAGFLPVAELDPFSVFNSSFRGLTMNTNSMNSNLEQSHCNGTEIPTTDRFVIDLASAGEIQVPSCSQGIHQISPRRNLPQRASKENALRKQSRRTIMKPRKNVSISSSSTLGAAEIKKIYTNKKLKNFHPTKLETIFEEPQSSKKQNKSIVDQDDNDSLVQFIGPKKLRRSISLCDGLKAGKTLIKQRRAKIKKAFGRRFALKKIPHDEFLKRLKKIDDNVEDDFENMASDAAIDIPKVDVLDAMEDDADENETGGDSFYMANEIETDSEKEVDAEESGIEYSILLSNLCSGRNNVDGL